MMRALFFPLRCETKTTLVGVEGLGIGDAEILFAGVLDRKACASAAPKPFYCSARHTPKQAEHPTMSDHSDVEEFETADAGASTTVPMQAGSVRKGGFMVIKGRPTKVRLRGNRAIPRRDNRPYTKASNDHTMGDG